VKNDCRTAAYRRRRGLTLLEVIVAMTVLAVGIVGVVGAAAACLRGSEAAAAYSRAALLAEQVAAEYARQEMLEPGAEHGAFDELASGYAWEAQVASADDEGLYPLRVTVSWEHGLRRYTLETALRPRPLPAPPVAEEERGGEGPAPDDGAGSAGGAGENPAAPGRPGG